jgi:hypothetical protein
MKTGMIVTVYEDPITETKVEGRAKLIRCIKIDPDHIDLWVVEFPDYPGRQVYRKINRHGKNGVLK